MERERDKERERERQTKRERERERERKGEKGRERKGKLVSSTVFPDLTRALSFCIFAHPSSFCKFIAHSSYLASLLYRRIMNPVLCA